jgi:hypothetical protein
MNAKEKFIERFQEKTGQHPHAFGQNQKALIKLVNADEELKELFQKMATEEIK